VEERGRKKEERVVADCIGRGRANDGMRRGKRGSKTDG
jgi:hypothetical protein